MQTLEQISEKVRDHLIAQNKQSRAAGGLCLYRNGNGLTCAVGCLIADEHYNVQLENQNVSRPDVLNALRASGIQIGDAHDDPILVLLQNWQGYHDGRYRVWTVNPEKHRSPTEQHEHLIAKWSI